MKPNSTRTKGSPEPIDRLEKYVQALAGLSGGLAGSFLAIKSEMHCYWPVQISWGKGADLTKTLFLQADSFEAAQKQFHDLRRLLLELTPRRVNLMKKRGAR